MIDYKDRPPVRDDGLSPAWKVGILAALILLTVTSYMAERDRVQVEKLLAMERAIEARRLRSADLAACPQRAEGDLDILVATIRTRADSGPVVVGCSRITERSYARSKK